MSAKDWQEKAEEFLKPFYGPEYCGPWALELALLLDEAFEEGLTLGRGSALLVPVRRAQGGPIDVACDPERRGWPFCETDGAYPEPKEGP